VKKYLEKERKIIKRWDSRAFWREREKGKTDWSNVERETSVGSRGERGEEGERNKERLDLRERERSVWEMREVEEPCKPSIEGI
jgi:hypothetical protein